MPGNLPHRGPHVRAWFENLLPDSKDIRERMARRYRAGSPDAFDLLSEAGRDCAGALQIPPVRPTGTASTGVAPLEADPLTEAQVAALLRATTTPQVLGFRGEDADPRISIAGAQEKTALLQMDGRWYLPHGATPTTHILKLPLGLIGGMKLGMHDSVENEWLCAQILAAYGLPVAACEPLAVLDDLVARTPEALAQVRTQLPPCFPAEVADSILAGVQGAAARLAASRFRSDPQSSDSLFQAGRRPYLLDRG